MTRCAERSRTRIVGREATTPDPMGFARGGTSNTSSDEQMTLYQYPGPTLNLIRDSTIGRRGGVPSWTPRSAARPILLTVAEPKNEGSSCSRRFRWRSIRESPSGSRSSRSPHPSACARTPRKTTTAAEPDRRPPGFPSSAHRRTTTSEAWIAAVSFEADRELFGDVRQRENEV